MAVQTRFFYFRGSSPWEGEDTLDNFLTGTGAGTLDGGTVYDVQLRLLSNNDQSIMIKYDTAVDPSRTYRAVEFKTVTQAYGEQANTIKDMLDILLAPNISYTRKAEFIEYWIDLNGNKHCLVIYSSADPGGEYEVNEFHQTSAFAANGQSGDPGENINTYLSGLSMAMVPIIKYAYDDKKCQHVLIVVPLT